jgi:hypothetical protein
MPWMLSNTFTLTPWRQRGGGQITSDRRRLGYEIVTI